MVVVLHWEVHDRLTPLERAEGHGCADRVFELQAKEAHTEGTASEDVSSQVGDYGVLVVAVFALWS